MLPNCLIAGVIIIIDIAEWFGEGRYRADGMFLVIVLALFAFVFWLFGRAVRYVLAGR